MKRIVSIMLCAAMLAGLLSVTALAGDSTAKVYTGTKSEIDATNQNKAYITVRSLTANEKRLKVIVSLGEQKYTYDLAGDGTREIYSLQMGSGSYTVKVLENVEGTKYAVIQTVTLEVAYESAFSPYLIPVQNINYTTASPAIAKAAELSADCQSDLERVNAVYSYIVGNIGYDTDKAGQISSGVITTYLPNVDQIYETGKGICFDYSSLMAAMLRSLGIPAKLVTGYVGDDSLYHAWNEVYLEGQGWVQVRSSVYFAGKTYTRMDPTFEASNTGGALSQFIGNGSNYLKKYEY